MGKVGLLGSLEILGCVSMCFKDVFLCIYRRRSKTVTDITIVEETPRKSPRQNAATFYSASQKASSASKTSNKNFSTAGESSSEDKTVLDNNKNSRTLHRSKSLNIHAVSSPRSKYSRWLNIDASSSSQAPHEGESFAEVFLETDGQNERNILSTCGTQGNVTNSQSVVYVPDLPSTTSTNRSGKDNISRESPSKPSTQRPPASSTASSKRSVSRRSNSSPSLSITPPAKPSKSPLASHKSFPTTSPVLFRTPTKTPKSSPINVRPDQIFDIAIPLTPVKSLVKPKKTHLARNSNLRTSPSGKSEEMTSLSEGVDTHSIVFVDSSSVRVQSVGVGTKSEGVVRDSEGLLNESEGIVAASPLLNRKRSVISSAQRLKTFNFENRNLPRCIEGDSGPTASDVTDGEVEKPGVENEVSESPAPINAEQNEVFKSPVATKRKRSTQTENVSPLNKILKQRKNNNRNTPPGKKC
jgi:hypothetical protein